MINKPNSNSAPAIAKLIYRIPGMVRLILRRDQYHFGLTMLALFGIVLAVGLVTNASFFTSAVDQVILQQELQDYSLMTGRPPFSTNVYVFPYISTPVTLESAERLKTEIANTLSAEVGLPLRYAGLQVTSGTMMLSPGADSSQYGDNFLGSVEVEYIADIFEQMVLDAGVPLDQDGVSTDVLQVWMHSRLAQEMGLQVGEDFIIRINLLTQPITVCIAGFWHAKDPKNEIWFTDPDSALKSAFLVRRGDYIKFIQPTLASGSGKVNWHIIL